MHAAVRPSTNSFLSTGCSAAMRSAVPPANDLIRDTSVVTPNSQTTVSTAPKARSRRTKKPAANAAFLLDLAQTYSTRRIDSLTLLAIQSIALALTGLVWLNAIFVCGWLFLSLGLLPLARRALQQFHGPVGSHLPRNEVLLLWLRGFSLGEISYGLLWGVFIGQLINAGGEIALTVGLVFALIYAAANLRITAPIPRLIAGPLLPLGIATILMARLVPIWSAAIPLAGLSGSILIYFVIIAREIGHIIVEKLTIQTEKDELITELERARVNSDLARCRAEEANLAKSRFLATMSHELRTPLNAILGFSEVMKGELFGAHVISSYKDYSNDIHSSGQHLLTLINEILDLSRIEAGRVDLKEESVSLAAIIGECHHLMALKAKKRGIAIEEFVEPNLPRLWADERALRQVMLNLLTNAIKFTPAGGLVTLKIGWTASGGQYVTISDSGPGIPEEEIPLVMTSFGRGSFAQKNALEGSGLGLPIVKGLVEMHNGTFRLKSHLHKGTEAIVTLPAERVLPFHSTVEANSAVKPPADDTFLGFSDLFPNSPEDSVSREMRISNSREVNPESSAFENLGLDAGTLEELKNMARNHTAPKEMSSGERNTSGKARPPLSAA